MQAHTRVLSTVLVRSVAVPALRLFGAIGALAIWGGGATTVATGYLIAELIALVLAIGSVLRVLPLGPTLHPGRHVARYARPLAAQRILESSTADFGNLVLSASRSTNLAALFTAALRFTEVANALFKAIGIAIAPMVSDIHGANQRDHLARLYKAASRWMFAIGTPAFLVQVLFGEWLLSLFGEEFTAAYAALVTLAIGQMVNYSSGVTVDIIRMIGRSGLMLANTVFDVTSYVLLNLLLIPRYGLEGAAPLGPEVSEALRSLAATEPGARIEHKGVSVSVHVRGAPDPEAASARLRGRAREIATRFACSTRPIKTRCIRWPCTSFTVMPRPLPT